jgi:diguanylate cyclase (GGDEF)-like protein
MTVEESAQTEAGQDGGRSFGAQDPSAFPPDQPPESGHHVLIVDDSEAIRRLVRETLEGMDDISSIEEAVDGLDGLGVLARKYCDLVITDVTMPRLDGFKFVAAIRQHAHLKDIMIILLSSRGESVDKITGLTIGANDYVTKPFEKGELQARVTVMFKMRTLQEALKRKNSEMEEANQKLALLANQDGLTGIPNRRYVFERLGVEFQRARRLKSPLSLLMIDIDHFKSFNDTYGHLSGDEALKTVAGTIQEGIRNYDMVGRYGGEEFIAFLPETDPEGAVLVAERLRSAVEEGQITPVEGSVDPVTLTVSIGVACWPEVEVDKVSELIQFADAALYRAKAEGRNRCILARADESSVA